MQFSVLGPVRVASCSGPVPVSGQLRTGLLALLLVRANRPVAAESLLNAFWGEQAGPEQRQRLQTNVHKLRRALGESKRLSFEAGSYRLQVEPGELDSDRFERRTAEAAETADPRRRVDLLRDALALWRGRPFQGLDLAGLVVPAQRLDEGRRNALEGLYSAELECGRHDEVVAELIDVARRHPLRERLQALLMTALYRSGKQADALAIYRTTRHALVDELGLEPGPELREAEQAILSGADPTTIRQAQPPEPPAELPASPYDFVGRDAELRALDTLCTADVPTAVVVTGSAGTGKSALATRWARDAATRFPDGQLFVDLQGFSPDDPVPAAVALGRFLRSLGDDPTTIPEDPVERATRFRTRSEGRRLLIVLDNAATAEQVRPLLPGSSSSFVVITSRQRLDGLVVRDGAHRLELRGLEDTDAGILVSTQLAAGSLTPEQVGELVRRCAGLPLALRVATARLRERTGQDPRRLLAALGNEDHLLDALDTGEDRSSVRTVLSWSYRRLPPDAAQLYRLCGFRCPHPEHHIDVHGAAALLGTSDVRTTRRLLDELVRCGVLEEVHDGRFRMHDLTRAHAAELATRSTDDPAAQLRLLAQHLKTAVAAASFIQPRETSILSSDLPSVSIEQPPDHAAALRWLNTRHTNLLCCAEFAAEINRPRLVIDLSTTVWPYLGHGRHLDEARRIHTLARDAARSLDDRPAEGIALRALGLLELHTDHGEKAVALLRNALALHDAAEDRTLHATTKIYFAAAHITIGRIDDAIRLAREAERNDTRTPAAATALIHLAELLRRHDQLQEAHRYQQLAHGMTGIDIEPAIGPPELRHV